MFVFALLILNVESSCNPCLCYMERMRCIGVNIYNLPRLRSRDMENIRKIHLENTRLRNIVLFVFTNITEIYERNNIFLNCSGIEEYVKRFNHIKVQTDCDYGKPEYISTSRFPTEITTSPRRTTTTTTTTTTTPLTTLTTVEIAPNSTVTENGISLPPTSTRSPIYIKTTKRNERVSEGKTTKISKISPTSSSNTIIQSTEGLINTSFPSITNSAVKTMKVDSILFVLLLSLVVVLILSLILISSCFASIMRKKGRLSINTSDNTDDIEMQSVNEENIYETPI